MKKRWTICIGTSFSKSIALLTAICYLWTSIFSQASYALADATAYTETKNLGSIINSFLLPFSLGRFTDAYSGTSPQQNQAAVSQAPLVILQDLHCNGEVQNHISRILGLLDKRFHIANVYVEGGIGQMDASWFERIIADKNARLLLTDALTKSGVMTGAEHYAVTSGNYQLLKGLEDGKPYLENLQRLGKMIKKRDAMNQKLSLVRSRVAALQNMYFTGKNKKLQKLIQSYKNNDISPFRYYTLLLKLSDRENINTYKYENIFEYLQMNELQKKINYGKVAKELKQFVAALKEQLPFSAYNKLMKDAGDPSRSEALYIELARVTKDYNLHLQSNFKNLNKLFTFIEANQKMNPLQLIEDERRLIMELYSNCSRDIIKSCGQQA
jgi:hypothetical protein